MLAMNQVGRRPATEWQRALCAAALGMLWLGAAAAQLPEPLTMLLDRGHVAQWLVCGPFEPDVSGGIVAALRRGEAPLGDRDYLAPMGGAARVRPRPLLAVPGMAREAVWQEMAATAPAVDLAGLFGDTPEGVAYAAFYVQSDVARAALFDLQTPLGARVWLNGFPLRQVRPAPAVSAGSDQFLVEFRQGENLVLIQ
ncbi:MAG TPA: hypothetical protein ENN65_09360, partial [Candidatus Hydrogenedentes bacterium]|nr:hypothetical protein [Candidatus Hydrogenedentota bacterium]